MPGEMNPDGTPKANNGGSGDSVPKVDFEAKVQELEKMRSELEDMRLEVFSPTYMEFLDAKDKGGKTPEPKPGVEIPIDFEKMSKKELFEKAKADAKSELREDIEKAKTDAVSTVSKEQKNREVAAFARTHTDFETIRPAMYGVSLDPKNKDLSLQELYDVAKAYITRNAGPSDEEKARQARLASEKPGGSSESFEKYQKMPAEQVAKESLQEVKDKLGPIPAS